MQNKNLDGLAKRHIKIRVIHTAAKKAPVISSHFHAPPSFVTPRRSRKVLSFNLHLYKKYLKLPKIDFPKAWDLIYRQRPVPVMAAVVALVVAFGGGVWATLATSHSSADDSATVEQPVPKVSLQVRGAPVADSSAPNQELYNLTIGQLEDYFTDLAESKQMVAREQLLADRKAKLKIYLQEKNSPLAAIVDTIAELKHWKMVLAISNSESSLGKRCYNNNCSGIGVEPGHELWRDYSSKSDWAKDLDRLLERRYKDWTLAEMNGVYNQPGSANWLSASTQILEEMKEKGIE